MRYVVFLTLSALSSGCAGGPTAPSTEETTAASVTTAPSTRGSLTVTSMGLSDAGQGAPGNWQYRVTVHLRETGGVDMTVTNIEVRARLGSNLLATASVLPMLTVLANSSSDAGLVFAADTHLGNLSTLVVDLTVDFRDASGNAGSVSDSFSCFGCWDY